MIAKTGFSYFCQLIQHGKSLAFATIFSLLFTFSIAQPIESSFQDAVLYLRWEEAKNIAEKNPNNIRKILQLHRIVFLQAVLYQTPTAIATFQTVSDSLIELFEKLPEASKHPEAEACLSFEKGAIFALNNELFYALYRLKDCKSIISEKSSFASDRFLLGTYHCFLSAIPKQYVPFLAMLGFSGDLQKGISLVSQTMREPEMEYAGFAAVVWYYIHKSLVANHSYSLQIADSLLKSKPDCPMYVFIKANGLLETKQIPECIQLLEKKLSLPNSDRLPYLYYQIGKAYFLKGEYSQALKYLKQIVTSSNAGIYQADAALKIGLSYSFLAQPQQAAEWFQKAKSVPNIRFDEDQYAQKTASRYLGQPPSAAQVQLLKARALCDGGQYADALAQLKTMPPILEQEKVEIETEIQYRTARIYHEWNNFFSAKIHYKLCLRQLPKINLYMQAYSAYYLGIIEESKGDLSSAKQLYKQALDYKNYDYQKGLEQKAISALERIKATE